VPVESLRIQVAQEYVEALGRAAYIFSYLEWSVVWCTDRMEPTYIQTVTRKTAGQIAKDFLRISEGLPRGQLREASVPLAIFGSNAKFPASFESWIRSRRLAIAVSG
jgi:hypothetical protein